MSGEACPGCGAENAPGALFCGRCGTPLARRCFSCGATVALDAAFCTTCGTGLGDPPRPSAEERKVVSVLFADLVGFTERAERLDPEEVRKLLDEYHSRVRDELERFGGTMEKFIGDAAVGLFGAPLAHEDDPERAVRAALAIREAAGELHETVRVGVTTGEALITRDARTLEGEGMAAGDVVNTASRLQSGASPGAILVDEATLRATEHAIEYRDAPAVEAKGKAESIRVWEALAPRARLGVDIAFRGAATLVGREVELDTLQDALARAKRERTAQLITLVGLPGIGKSRLVYELWATVEANPDLVYWRQGRSLPYGAGVSFWALGEMAKSHAGILENDSAESAERKLLEAVEHAIPDEAERRWIGGHLRPLVGLGREGAAGDQREEAFAAWRRFFEALAEERPLVLVFEDIHWADDGLLDFIDHLVEWTADVPVLVVCTARPELLDRRADWGGGKRNAATISLPSLTDEDVSRLLEELVGEPRPELVPRAGGNPLYAEEYARMLAQTGNGGALVLPDSVQGIIAARLDTLPLDEKAVVQDAAVLGKVFWSGELAHLTGLGMDAIERQLRSVERKEFVRRERRSSVAGETAYVFRHALVRDVAYGQLPRGRRIEKHQLAAEWIESLGGDRSEDLADVVAHHYLSALELARATGRETAALEQRARLALREAGDRAARLHAPVAAGQFYEAALELLPADDPDRPDLLYRYAFALRPQGRGVETLVETADVLLDAGDRERAAEVQAMTAEVLWTQGIQAEAFEYLEGASQLLDDARPSRQKAYVLASLARYRMNADEAETAVSIARQALEMASSLELDDLRAHALNTIGLARTMLGEPDGIQDLERALEIDEALNHPDVTRAYNNLSSIYATLGDLERGFELLDKGLEAARRFGWVIALTWLQISELDKLYAHGRWDEALERIRTFLGPETEAHRLERDLYVMRSLMGIARGRVDEALEDSSRALQLVPEAQEPQSNFPSLACRAWVLTEAGALGADEFLDELAARWKMSPATGGAMWLAFAAAAAERLGRTDDLLEAARASHMQTRWVEAAIAYCEGAFSEAARIYARIGSQPDEALARLRAAEALIAAGRTEEANAERELALELFHRVGAARYIAQAEALLAGSS